MKKTALQLQPLLMLSLLTLALALSACGMAGRAVKPSACPTLLPPPSNVMRPPSAEPSLRGLLFESAATPTTNSAPAKLSSPQTVPRAHE